MKNVITWSLTVLLASAVSAASATTVVDFSTMPDQANYSGNSDFSVTTYGGPETDLSLNPHISAGWLVNSSDPGDLSSSYPTEDIIEFRFNLGLESLTLDMYWADDPDTLSTGVTATSFDVNGNILQQFGYLPGNNAIYNFDSSELIYSIQTNTNLLPSRDDWWYGINSVSYNVSAVPEPSSIALMLGGVGLVGFMAMRRRKQV